MIGARIKLAREIRGLTQAELAEMISTTQSGVAAIESGRFRPSRKYLESIALKTGFDLSFFDKESFNTLPQGSLLYRAHSSVVKKAPKARAHAEAELALELALFLSSRLNRIPVQLPRLHEETEPARCARITRDSLGFPPNKPIFNLLGQLEKNGVFVVVLPTPVEGLDGFSAWTPSRFPLIALSRGKSVYRTRFTAAEELGHCVMHAPLRVSVKEADKQARQFAQEFLLPEEAMMEEMDRPVTLSALAEMKPRWGASIAFLAKRARSLNLVTQNQYRYLAQQIRARWGKVEPGDTRAKPESPRLIAKMVELLYGQPPDISLLSRESGIPKHFIRAIVTPLGIPQDEPVGKVIPFREH